MTFISEYFVYAWVIIFFIYGVLIVPYFGAKILMKAGKNERFWFFILIIFGFWALLFIFLRPSLRKEIEKADRRYLMSFAVGYLFLLLLFFLSIKCLINIDDYSISYNLKR